MSENTATTCPACGKELDWSDEYYFCEYCGHQFRDTPEAAIIKRFFADVEGFAELPNSHITSTMLDDYREQFAEIGINVDEPVKS